MRRQGWWLRVALWRQGLVGVFVLIAGVLQAMDQYDISPSWKWAHGDRTLFWTTVAAGIAVLVNTVGDVTVQRHAVAGEANRVDIHKAALGALVAISEETRLKITDLGANVFLVRRGFSHLMFTWQGRTVYPGRRPRLERIERIRLSDYPMVSNVPWTAGKGVIGACWDHGRAEYVHWAPLAKTGLPQLVGILGGRRSRLRRSRACGVPGSPDWCRHTTLGVSLDTAACGEVGW